MKKSLVLLVAIVATVAFAGTACAFNWGCYEMPPCKVTCKPEVLCKGAAKGAIKLCGPCAPTVMYKGRWITMVVCPPGPKPVAKAIKKRMKK